MSVELLYLLAVILIIPTIIFVSITQSKVHKAIGQYMQVPCALGKPAHQVVKELLDAQIGENAIRVTKGKNSDYYNPRTKEIVLSAKVYDSTSVAAIGIALHEAGHAIQHATGYKPMKIRQAIAPIVSFGASLVWLLFLIGTILLFTSYFAGTIVLYVAIGLYALTTLFYAITYPVEKDASKRALQLGQQEHIFTEDEILGATVVLKAAAQTYFAALVMSMVELFRFIALVLLYTRRD